MVDCHSRRHLKRGRRCSVRLAEPPSLRVAMGFPQRNQFEPNFCRCFLLLPVVRELVLLLVQHLFSLISTRFLSPPVTAKMSRAFIIVVESCHLIGRCFYDQNISICTRSIFCDWGVSWFSVVCSLGFVMFTMGLHVCIATMLLRR